MLAAKRECDAAAEAIAHSIAPTKEEAIALLERLRYKINLAIVELELAECGGLDLIRQ